MSANIDEYAAARAEFRAFVDRHIGPRAAEFDRDEHVPASVIQSVAREGYLGYTLPQSYGGRGQSAIALGFLSEHVGRACSSVRSLLTVHGMVGHSLLQWGTAAARAAWLPQLADGSVVAAFALSEANSGSDARAIETTARRVENGFVLNGVKKWISFGQIAGLFLVFARCDDQPAAFLVARATPGVTATPVGGLLGLRGSMVADLQLRDCQVPDDALVGRLGFGLSHVAGQALDFGRYTVAWGCVGIAHACLAASIAYARERKQAGRSLKDHQLIQRMLTNMIVDVRAARLLCFEAGRLKDARDPEGVLQTSIAKYFSARAAVTASRDAVQIHGARGCTSDSAVGRHFRDAKIMQIIEGTDEMHQLAIAQHVSDLDS